MPTDTPPAPPPTSPPADPPATAAPQAPVLCPILTLGAIIAKGPSETPAEAHACQGALCALFVRVGAKGGCCSLALIPQGLEGIAKVALSIGSKGHRPGFR